MKKIILSILVGLMTINIVACSNNKPETEEPETTPPAKEEPEVTGTLEEIMEQIYGGVEIELPQTAITSINDENIEYFLGTSEIEYDEAIASEPMISSTAHSVVLVKVSDESDIEDIKEKIKANVDGRKWICVGVEDDQIIVDNIGNLVILIMDENSETIHQSFLALSK